MALDPSILLQGQGVNALGAIAAGNEAAAQQLGFQRQRDYNAMLKQNGAGIVGGDMNALNALAAYDPMQALNVQQGQLSMQGQKQDMAFRAEEMAMKREASKRQAEQWLAEQASTFTKEQLAAEAAQMESALSGAAYFYQNKDQAGYNQFLQSKGINPAEYPFEQFPAYAAEYGGVLDAMKTFAPPAIDERYKVVGGSLFDLGAEGGPAAVGQGAMQETMVMGPDGKPIMVQGGPGTTAKFTEGQSKDNVYATRAEGALAKLEPVADALTERSGVIGEALSGATLGLSRDALQTDEFQVARNAGDEFLQAILRKDTGAAITAQEQELYGKTFLPQPGDGQAVLQAKREARVRAIEAIRAGMNAQQLEAVARAEANAIARLGGGQASQPAGAPQAGAVEDGYRFKGGDPADPNNWEQVQ